MKNQATLQEVQAELKSILAKYEKFEVAIYSNGYSDHIRVYSNDNVLFSTPSLKDVMDVCDKHNKVICIIDNYAQVF